MSGLDMFVCKIESISVLGGCCSGKSIPQNVFTLCAAAGQPTARPLCARVVGASPELIGQNFFLTAFAPYRKMHNTFEHLGRTNPSG